MIINMKEEWIKPIANITFFLFLCALTIYGLIHIASNTILQIIIGIIAFVLDLYMLYVLAKAQNLWKTKIDINKWKACGFFLVYTAYTVIYVFLFAVGFFMTELDANEQIVERINTRNEIVLNKIKTNQSEIDAYVIAFKAENETTLGKKAKEIEEKINKLKAENQELELSLAQTSQGNVEVSKNFLLSLQKVLGWSVRTLKILLFGLLVVLMQFSLISSSTSIKISDNIEKQTNNLSADKKELLTVLDAFFEGKNGNGFTNVTPLNGVDVVSKKTSLSKDKCIYWRNYLSKLKVNGGMAFSIKQGVTYANYKKDFIRDYILSH